MAVLTNADYKQIRAKLYSAASGKEELKARANLPNETQLKAGFQALEDHWESQRLTFKTNLDVALGFVTNAALARFIFVAWFMNRLVRGL